MWSAVQVGSGCQAPSSRSKHAMCAAQNGNVYLLGGRSANLPLKDLWKFDPVQNVWEELRCRGNRPPCLQEHTMVSWKNMVYVFGGEIGFASTGETPLWLLDLNVGTWRKHHVRGMSAHQPSGRRGHTAVVYNGTMYVYGGYQDLRGSSSELWTFDLSTERWHLILIPSHQDQPAPRHNHSCVVHDGAMWVFGGLTDLQARGDFWRWDFVTEQWSRVKSQRGPGELYGHAAVKAMAYMYIFGGERSGVALNELWRYHFATECWERIHAEGILPPPRCRHVAVANPALQNWESQIQAWGCNVHHLKEGTASDKIPPLANPPKSISMCFGQNQAEPENGRKHFKFRVHPMSRLCSKSTSSDEDDDEEYTVSYNHSSAQVNLRSLREKISSSRLVRSISSGSYSILHNQSAHDGRHDELERLVEEGTPQQQHRPRPSIQKSHSSDAVLESDSESATPQHQARPRSELLPGQTTDSPPLWVENSNSSVCPSSWSDGYQQHGHQLHHLALHSVLTNGRTSAINGETPSSATFHHANSTTPTSAGPPRPVRLGYDGPLSTVRDVEEENSESADDPTIMATMMMTNSNSDHLENGRKTRASEMLIDLDPSETDHERSRCSTRFISSYTLSDLASQTYTPSIESRELPHSVSHSSGYHSFTDEEGGSECHREFAGCLNSSANRKPSLRGRDLELKTFTPTHQPRTPADIEVGMTVPPVTIFKERARSWDRASQRRQVRSYPAGGSITPTTLMSTEIVDDSLHSLTTARTLRGAPLLTAPKENITRQSPSRRWSRSPAKQKPAQHEWQLCLYMFGGREQGVPGVYRQPISVWKLYV